MYLSHTSLAKRVQICVAKELGTSGATRKTICLYLPTKLGIKFKTIFASENFFL